MSGTGKPAPAGAPSDKSVIFGTLLGAAVTMLAGSTVFFRYQEGWSWIDAWFFTVTTVSTVGYGDLVPATPLGKLATTALIFIGIGIFGLTATQIADQMVSRRVDLHDLTHRRNAADKGDKDDSPD